MGGNSLVVEEWMWDEKVSCSGGMDVGGNSLVVEEWMWEEIVL